MQNINLYLPELRPKRQWLQASTASALTLGVLVLLMVLGLIASTTIKEYQHSVATLEQKVARAEANLKQLQAKNLGGETAKIDRQIDQLRQAISRKSHIANVIGSKDLGNSQGYSERLKDIARVSNRQFSLNSMRFTLGEKRVELRGLTKESTVVADFVSQLKQRPSFETATFARLSLVDNKKRQGTFQFSFGYEPLFDYQSDIGGLR